jgi:hypothetical protein
VSNVAPVTPLESMATWCFGILSFLLFGIWCTIKIRQSIKCITVSIEQINNLQAS